MELIASRSNTFRVKNLKTLKESFRTYGLSTQRDGEGDILIREKDKYRDGSSLISIAVDGFMPQLDIDAVADRLNLNDDVPDTEIPQEHTDIPDLVADHLVEGEVAIFVGASIIKLAEINAYGVAVDSSRGRKAIQLVDLIMDMAQELKTDDSPVTAPYA